MIKNWADFNIIFKFNEYNSSVKLLRQLLKNETNFRLELIWVCVYSNTLVLRQLFFWKPHALLGVQDPFSQI